jgi:glycosyltransferase involved in cell wall biosynthesis
MKVYTCTPVRFRGDYTFFARESGLFSVGLNEIGVESRPVMPGPAMEDDDPRLVRTEYRNLETESWWRSLELDGLILYSWAAPRYNAIAEAVRAAGIPLLVNMDTCGLVSPLASPGDWWREAHVCYLKAQPGIAGRLGDIAKATIEVLFHPVAKRRLRHYEAATAVASVTPHGARWIPNEAIRLGRPELADKFLYLPHPQLPIFTYDGTPKQKLILTVGRWHRPDWPQKNPRVLLETYRRFLCAKPDWRGMIVGGGAPDLPRLLRMDFPEIANRLEFVDYVKPEALPDLYRRARIGFWSSRWEGQQGTGAQALCCGCTVVSTSSAQNSCFRHYVTRESGRLAPRNAPDALSDELVLEADAWEGGERDAERISRIWRAEFHAPEVARRALEALTNETLRREQQRQTMNQ